MHESTENKPTEEPADDLGALAQALGDLLSAFRVGAGLTQRQRADRIG